MTKEEQAEYVRQQIVEWKRKNNIRPYQLNQTLKIIENPTRPSTIKTDQEPVQNIENDCRPLVGAANDEYIAGLARLNRSSIEKEEELYYKRLQLKPKPTKSDKPTLFDISLLDDWYED